MTSLDQHGHIDAHERIRDPEDVSGSAAFCEQLETLDRLHAATTQGKWDWSPIWDESGIVDNAVQQTTIGPHGFKPDNMPVCTMPPDEINKPNAAWIAESHNAWPAISQRLKTMRDERNHAARELAEAIIREQAANAECDRLRAWKEDAMTVFARWNKCHEAAGRPGNIGELASESTECEIQRLKSSDRESQECLTWLSGVINKGVE